MPLLISAASVRSIPFLSFIALIFAWHIPLVSLTFLRGLLVLPVLLFLSIPLHWSLKKAFLSLLAILNSDDCIYYCAWASLRRNGIVLIVNKRVWNAVFKCNLKNKIFSVHFKGKPFHMTIIQDYAPTTNAEEVEVDWFCEDLQDILELTHTHTHTHTHTPNDVLFIIGIALQK